ncbi:MAG: hypothetical protein ACRDRR_19070 [Pseudonocardiaceae bacterium]
MNQACDDAGHQPGCLNFHVNYTTKKKSSDKECTVDDVSPNIGTPVTTSTRVRLKVSCGTSESDTSQTDTDTTDKKQNQTNTDTNDKKQNQTDTDTNDKKTNERGE